MSFLKISHANLAFYEKTLTWKFYTTSKALPTTKQVQLVDPKEFVIAALDIDSKTFVVHMIIWEQEEMPVHSKRQAQVEALLFNKAPTAVLAEYSNFNNVFLAENTAKLPENTGINKHTSKLEESKYPTFGRNYNLEQVELETLKTYINTNLTNGFTRPSKSPAGALILFDKKPDGSLCLYVDYLGFNNITIKNQYLLLLNCESWNWLDCAKRFTQWDLTYAYHKMRIYEGNK